MKILSGLLALLILLPIPLAAQDSYEIVLRVNERISTTWDYQRRRADKIRMIQGAESLPPQQQQRMLANVGVSTMDDIFEELLMLSRADQLGLRVNESDLERGLATTMQNYGMESEEQFAEALRASGMSLEGFRENLSKSLLMQKLMGQEVHPRVRLEEEDLRRFYQNHLDEYQEPERLSLQEVVILSDSGFSSDETEQTAQEIRRQIEGGGDLSEVAAAFAEKGLTSNAVDLGWVEIGDLDADLEEAVWNLEAGGVSEPVKGRGGLHILVVAERLEARLRTFGEVEQQIRATEGERLLSSEMQKYLEELEAAAYVVVNPPPDAIGFRASLQMAADTDDLEQALTAPLITQPLAEELVDKAAEPSVEEDSSTPEQDSDEPPLD